MTTDAISTIADNGLFAEPDRETSLAPFQDLLENAPAVDVQLYGYGAAVVNLRTYSAYHARRFRETGNDRELEELRLCRLCWQRMS